MDLSKEFNGSASDFDGQGHGLPDAMLPPDGTAEVDSHEPAGAGDQIGGKPGPPLYPDGYYASRADHAAPVPVPGAARPNNVVVCRGQTISLPGGNYKAIHLLAAASGGQPVSAAFGVGGSSPTVAIADWTRRARQMPRPASAAPT